LGDGDTLASGPAESPVELWTDVSRKSAVGGRVCMDRLGSGRGTPRGPSSASYRPTI